MRPAHVALGQAARRPIGLATLARRWLRRANAHAAWNFGMNKANFALAVDLLAAYLEEVIGSARGRAVSANVQKLSSWYARRGGAELLTSGVKFYIARILNALQRQGLLAKSGNDFILTPNSKLWKAAEEHRAREYLASALRREYGAVPSLPLERRQELARAKQLEALIGEAKRAGAIDESWISRACFLLATGGKDKEVRAKVLRAVRRAEGALSEKVQLWLESGVDPSEAWTIYSRFVETVELLAYRPDRKAAERLCQALIWAFSTVRTLYLARAFCINKER